MRTRGKVGMILGLVGLTALAVLAVSHPADAVPCGPGPHWVDTCPSGTDKFLSDSSHGVVIFDPEDGGQTINLPSMAGSSEVFRQAGTTVPDHHIVTEMNRLFLSGGGLTIRAGDGFGNPSLFSPGRITEQPTPPNGTSAHSFFNIFFEISGVPMFGTLHNNNPLDNILGEQPCRMAADIDRVPPPPLTFYGGCGPQAPDIGPEGPPIVIDLFDAGGTHRAILTTQAFHIVGPECDVPGGPPCPGLVPEPSTLLLVGIGLAGFGAVAWRRKRRCT